MKTAFATGPGFFAVNTHKGDPTLPTGVMRLIMARLEAHDGPAKHGTDFDNATFTVFAAMCEGKPAVARAMIALHDHLAGNMEMIKAEAEKP